MSHASMTVLIVTMGLALIAAGVMWCLLVVASEADRECE